jgi:two-component system, NtrC family, sensor kinase
VLTFPYSGKVVRYVMKFWHTLTFRVLVGSCLLLLVLFSFYSYLAVRLHTGDMMSQVIESAGRVSDIIKNSTRYSMLLNRREDVFQIINTIGKEPGVEGIRIYNKRGEIMFSTTKAEEGSIVDMHAEACYACHDSAEPLHSLPAGSRARIYTSPRHSRIVGLINPIRNEPSCSEAACHAHPADKTVLGVLDVRMSLERADARIGEARKRLVLYAGVITVVVAIGSGLFLYVAVHRPVKVLMEGTRQISSGNLEHHIEVGSQDELGQLAHSFNDMTRILAKVETENRTWSETLEKRVEEKTAELKQVHQQILQIEKMASLGKLSATVAHELNNPLEGILTYGKLIAKRLRRIENPLDQVTQTLEDLDLVIHEVQRCGNIVKNLLLFSRKQVGEIGMAQLDVVINRAVQLMQHHFKISNVRFEQSLETPDTTLMCDENQIQQALVALFVNAVEAMPNGGTLKLRLTHSATGELEIRLSDTGTGIAPEDLEHVFEPFFTTKKEGKGVGLGLSVVFGIIERHGGNISVQSQPAQGTTFTIVFPPAAKHHPRVEPPGDASSRSSA